MKWLGCVVVLLGVADCKSGESSLSERQIEVPEGAIASRVPEDVEGGIAFAYGRSVEGQYLTNSQLIKMADGVEEFQKIFDLPRFNGAASMSREMFNVMATDDEWFRCEVDGHDFRFSSIPYPESFVVRSYSFYDRSRNKLIGPKRAVLSSSEVLQELANDFLKKLYESRFAPPGCTWEVKQINWRGNEPIQGLYGSTHLPTQGIVFEMTSFGDLPIEPWYIPEITVTLDTESGRIRKYQYDGAYFLVS